MILKSIHSCADAFDTKFKSTLSSNNQTHCGLFVVHLSDSQCWPLKGVRQDNPSHISLGIMGFEIFESLPVLTALSTNDWPTC